MTAHRPDRLYPDKPSRSSSDRQKQSPPMGLIGRVICALAWLYHKYPR